MQDRLAQLTRANAREILAAFKLDRLGRLQGAAEWLAGFPARRLSRQILRFDDIVGEHGLAAGGRYLLDEFTGSTHIEGACHVPPRGPLLAVANHPGMMDAMAIWVALERRPDLKIIAFERDILRLIPNVRSRLLFVRPCAGNRSGLLREAASHLRRGSALLTFPAGSIEPDPAVRAAEPLLGWSDSTDLLVRLVPETVVLPIAVSGVISTTAHRHRLASRFTDPKERDWAAATLQVLFRRLRDTHTRVVVGEPIVPGRSRCQRAAMHAAMAALLARAGNGRERCGEASHGRARPDHPPVRSLRRLLDAGSSGQARG